VFTLSELRLTCKPAAKLVQFQLLPYCCTAPNALVPPACPDKHSSRTHWSTRKPRISPFARFAAGSRSCPARRATPARRPTWELPRNRRIGTDKIPRKRNEKPFRTDPKYIERKHGQKVKPEAPVLLRSDDASMTRSWKRLATAQAQISRIGRTHIVCSSSSHQRGMRHDVRLISWPVNAKLTVISVCGSSDNRATRRSIETEPEINKHA